MKRKINLHTNLGQSQSKKLFFLVAMPRSGNTLFASIMNQNPEIAATPNSITLEIMKDLVLLKKTDVFLNYPDHKSLNNVLDSVYDNYYKDWTQRIIIDRGPVTTVGNLAIDPIAAMFVLGCTIDYVQELGGSYLKVTNPNAVASCGCGESFAV